MICGTLVCLLAVLMSTCAEPRVTPKHQQLRTPGAAVINCKFPRPLINCSIRVSDHYNRTFNAVLDFGYGRLSDSVTLKAGPGGAQAVASYAGNDLAAGHCGMKLQVKVYHLAVLVECFGQSKKGSWSRGFGLVTTDEDKVLASFTSTPRLMVTDQGSNMAVHLTTQGSLDVCNVLTPFEWWVDLSPGQTIPDGSRYRALSTLPEQGECGAVLTDLQPVDAGVWSWWAASLHPLTTVWQAAVVLVTIAPVGEPTLTMHRPRNLKEGDELRVTCHAPAGVPAAKLTWLLDGKMIRRDTLNDTLYDDVGAAHPWQPQATVQTLVYQLTSKNQGKRLQCRVEHPAQTGVQSVSMLLHFEAAPASAVPDCGERGGSINVLIAGGEAATAGEFPWHVGVYKSLKQVCGGTLVSETFVISAAHCFWDVSRSKLQSHTLYKMAADKFHRDWNPLEKGTQTRDVAKIHVPPRYRDRASNYQYDIAVVQVTRAFTWKPSVAPICMDWSGTQVTLPHGGVMGTVVGWGLTNQDVLNPDLLKIDLPFVEFDTCFNALPEYVKKLYTDDKFCAGFAFKNRSVCQGDSGGGLVFAPENRYFLQGVVSVNFRSGSINQNCYSEMYTAFTDVSHYLPWIKKIVDP